MLPTSSLFLIRVSISVNVTVIASGHSRPVLAHAMASRLLGAYATFPYYKLNRKQPAYRTLNNTYDVLV